MEAKKLDLWVIVLAVLMYGTVHFFALQPTELYVENLVLLSLLFGLSILAYFSGLVMALGMAAVTVFFYGSYVMYGNVVLGDAVQSHVYYWMVLLPAVTVVAALIGVHIRRLQEENLDMKAQYAELVTVDPNTGLGNGKLFYTVLHSYMGLSRRYHIPLSLMLVQVMYYEDIRRIVGPDKIRDVVKYIGTELVESTRSEDCSYMLEDGRTFAVLLLGQEEGAKVVKTRIKEHIRQFHLEGTAKSAAIKLELKIGIAVFEEQTHDVIGLRKAAEKDMEYDV